MASSGHFRQGYDGPMERGSDKHSPRLDEQMSHETEGLVRGGHTNRAEEWRDPEPPGEDQPEPDRAPNSTLVGGTPPGMDADDVEGRAQLAGYLGKEIYPAVRDILLDRVIDMNAPDAVIDLVKRLPSGREYANVNEVWEAVGGNVETRRT